MEFKVGQCFKYAFKGGGSAEIYYISDSEISKYGGVHYKIFNLSRQLPLFGKVSNEALMMDIDRGIVLAVELTDLEKALYGI